MFLSVRKKRSEGETASVTRYGHRSGRGPDGQRLRPKGVSRVLVWARTLENLKGI